MVGAKHRPFFSSQERISSMIVMHAHIRVSREKTERRKNWWNEKRGRCTTKMKQKERKPRQMIDQAKHSWLT